MYRVGANRTDGSGGWGGSPCPMRSSARDARGRRWLSSPRCGLEALVLNDGMGSYLAAFGMIDPPHAPPISLGCLVHGSTPFFFARPCPGWPLRVFHVTYGWAPYCLLGSSRPPSPSSNGRSPLSGGGWMDPDEDEDPPGEKKLPSALGFRVGRSSSIVIAIARCFRAAFARSRARDASKRLSTASVPGRTTRIRSREERIRRETWIRRRTKEPWTKRRSAATRWKTRRDLAAREEPRPRRQVRTKEKQMPNRPNDEGKRIEPKVRGPGTPGEKRVADQDERRSKHAERKKSESCSNAMDQ